MEGTLIYIGEMIKGVILNNFLFNLLFTKKYKLKINSDFTKKI
jgi:hypothetical protein